jgi:hypothetical protein
MTAEGTVGAPTCYFEKAVIRTEYAFVQISDISRPYDDPNARIEGGAEDRQIGLKCI